MARIDVVVGNIAVQVADVIVNAANSSLLGGRGVDGAIHAAGGPEILAECKEIRARDYPQGLGVGGVVVTGPGRLSCRYVIHTVGPIHGEDPRESTLARCYWGSIELANQLGARSIAFPLISAGAYGWPVAIAAKVAVEAVRGAIATAGLDEVRFVLARESIAEVLRSLLK